MTSQTKIKSITSFEALDSRGFPTVSVTVELQNGVTGTSLVPSGASTGEFEAVELRDGDEKRYLGKGVKKAVKNVVENIQKNLVNLDAIDQVKIDQTMLEIDGTSDKSNLGANAILGVSLAVAHAAANSQKIPLFQHLATKPVSILPIPLVNVINGGAHAANSLDFQEFMLVPHTSLKFSENLRCATEIFHILKRNLKKKKLSVGLGDEGGFAPELSSPEDAIICLLEAISDAGYQPGSDVSIALDVAASELFDEQTGKYVFKKSSREIFTSDDLIEMYTGWSKKYPLVSIEDGLDENDWAGWKKLTDKIGNTVQLVGDDLFVTNKIRLQEGINKKVGNSILVKLNQIGSLTETLDTIKLAQENRYSCVISHRSGETEDTSIADLSVAVEAGQIKTGSVCRSERTAKYNRLLWIEQYLGEKAVVKNPFKRS